MKEIFKHQSINYSKRKNQHLNIEQGYETIKI